jgi:hypothetical protein
VNRLRRFVRKALKPLAMVGIVGALSVSLVVTTPSNAQAFTSPAAVPVVLGAARMAIPALMPALGALGPVGWGLAGVAAVAMVGLALYETRDTWVPWVQGTFGTPDGVQGVTATGLMQGFTIDSHEISGNTVSGYYSYVGQPGVSGAWTSQFDRIAHCQYSDGITEVYTLSTSSVTHNHVNAFTNFRMDFPLCPSGWTTLGGKIGGGGGAESSGSYTPRLAGDGSIHPNPAQFQASDTAAAGGHGTTNIITWGSMNDEEIFNPRSGDVKYKTTVECIAPDGTLSEISQEWRGDSPGMVIPSCAAAGKGHGTGAIRVEGFAPGTLTDPEVLWDVAAPSQDPTQYPLCSPSRPSSGCKVAVHIDTKECVVGLWDCEHWPDLRNDPTQSPRVSCQYGPYSVPIETCNPLERAYEEGGAPATEPNIDGNPATRSDNNLDGQPIPKTQPATGTVPGGAGAPAPGSSTAEADCWPTGWGMLNPLEWVYKPITCAGKELFQPKKDIQLRINTMSTQFSNKVPVSWFGVGLDGVSGGSCPAHWKLDFRGHTYPFICGTPADGIIQSFRPFLGAMLVIAMLWPLIRSLFYAAIPIFKVNPS